MPRHAFTLALAFLFAACASTPRPATQPSDKPKGDAASSRPTAGATPRPRDVKAPPREGQFAADQLLVSFEASASPEERQRVRARHNLEKIEDLPGSGLELVRILDGASPPERAQQVSEESSVRYAEPNFISRTQS